MKEHVQKQKKKYERKGKRKEILFKDDEWEIVKKNADRMGLDTSKYINKPYKRTKPRYGNKKRDIRLTTRSGSLCKSLPPS